MANWCSTSYVIESENKELLQQICDAINECASMMEPLVPGSSASWAGNTFKKLGIDPNESDRTFWSAAEIENGHLKFFEESAWDRGDAIAALDDHYTSEDGDSELAITFVSEELGCGIFQTNDSDGYYFSDKYIFSTDDDMCFYESFDELKKDVQEHLGVDTDFKSVEEMTEALDKASEEDESKYGNVYEIEYTDLR